MLYLCLCPCNWLQQSVTWPGTRCLQLDLFGLFQNVASFDPNATLGQPFTHETVVAQC
jgi:hypothetical protein